MTLTRRQLLGQAAAAAGVFTLGDSLLGILDGSPLAEAQFLALDTSELDGSHLAAWPPLGRFEAQDWRSGNVMWDGAYSDQPYMVRLPDGGFVSVLTVSDSDEGSHTEHIIVLRSVDDGATWTTVAELEPADGPEAAYALPWLAPSGRLFVVYTYNIDDVRAIPNMDGTTATERVDCVGVVAYRSSIDGGMSWSSRREIPMPVTDIDLRNPWAGANQMFWMTSQPALGDDSVRIGVSKAGTVVDGGWADDTEAFIATLREKAPGRLELTLSAPIKSPNPITEEPSPIVFPDGVVNVAFRSNLGQLGEAWSTDDGATWTVDWARDRSGSVIPQPRANATQIPLPDGRLLLWGHNNASAPDAGWGPRNPVFYRVGERVGDRIVWGAPRLLIWDKQPPTAISYPGFIIDGDALLVAATDKQTARIFRFPLSEL